MKLYLVRHGDAVASHINPERPLSPQGTADVRKVADFLHKAGVSVGEIYHSTKLRAKQTAEVIQTAVGPKARLAEKKYLSPEDDIKPLYDELSTRKKDLMVVSHLPFLPRLISKLVLGDEGRSLVGLATSSVVAMYRETAGDWQIVWVVDPFLLS